MGVLPMKKEIKREGKKEVEIVNIVVSTSLEKDIPLEKMAAFRMQEKRLPSRSFWIKPFV